MKSIQKYLTKIITKPDNLILCSDGYKYSHHKFYGDEMTKMISYMESRGGKFEETVFYGLQIVLQPIIKIINKIFFIVSSLIKKRRSYSNTI